MNLDYPNKQPKETRQLVSTIGMVEPMKQTNDDGLKKSTSTKWKCSNISTMSCAPRSVPTTIVVTILTTHNIKIP